MVTLLLAAYDMLPKALHCANGRHKWPCRIMIPVLRIFTDDKPCPRRNLPRAPKTW